MMQSYTKFVAFFFGVVVVVFCTLLCVCIRDRSKNLQSKKIDRYESAPLDVYGLGNLATVTKINLHTHTCMRVHYV